MPVELPELSLSSKTPGNTPEVIAQVLTDLGYDAPKVETVTVQETPAEAAAATEAAETAAAETQAAEEAAAAEVEETARKSRNQKKRDAREKLQADLAAANERAERVERELAEFKNSTTTQIEEIRNAPPKKEEPPLEAPKKPARADFIDSDDPDDAYDDAKYKWRRDMETYEQKLAEKDKPAKVDPPPAAPAARPVAAASFSDEELAKTDLKEIKDQSLRRFIENTQAVTQKHPGAYKAIVDNVPNVNDAIVQAGHMFDEPARIALYLAKHPDESKRIKELTTGDVRANPRLIRIAQKELEKIEQLAAEEDAAPAPPAGGNPDAANVDDEVDPDDDPSAATINRQPQRTEVPPAATHPPAAQAPPAQPKKHTPIEPVGARGAQTEKPYDQMTAAEQKDMWNSPGGPEKVRKLKGLL